MKTKIKLYLYFAVQNFNIVHKTVCSFVNKSNKNKTKQIVLNVLGLSYTVNSNSSSSSCSTSSKVLTRALMFYLPCSQRCVYLYPCPSDPLLSLILSLSLSFRPNSDTCVSAVFITSGHNAFFQCAYLSCLTDY